MSLIKSKYNILIAVRTEFKFCKKKYELMYIWKNLVVMIFLHLLKYKLTV